MNTTPFIARAGFTLVEAMIAIALGSLIVYTAVSGFRTAAQTVTMANRLSLENSLLRSGYFEAQQQLDFWTNLDDPTKPDAERPLTQIDSNKGLPFTPMKTIWPKVSSTSTTSPRTPSRSDGHYEIMPRHRDTFPKSFTTTDKWEEDICWDPYYAWSPHDPRTWSRVNMAEKDMNRYQPPSKVWIPHFPENVIPHFIFGRYAIFGNANYTLSNELKAMKVQPDFTTVASMSSWPTPVNLDYKTFPTAGTHLWYQRQMRAMVNCLGYAAMMEYLPPNSIYTYYLAGPSVADTSEGGLAKIAVQPSYGFCNGDGSQLNSRGIYRQTYSTSYGYMNPRTYDNYGQAKINNTNTPSTATLRDWHYRRYTTDYGAYDEDSDPNTWQGVNDMRWIVEHAGYAEPLMKLKPTHWPETLVSVGRWVKNARFVALAKVQRISPLTGEVIELSWTGLGTSLRGARMQRHQTSGWAKWDNKIGSSGNDPNLDSP